MRVPTGKSHPEFKTPEKEGYCCVTCIFYFPQSSECRRREPPFIETKPNLWCGEGEFLVWDDREESYTCHVFDTLYTKDLEEEIPNESD